MVRPIGKTFKTGSTKPPKARTTCIYLDETRICRCEKSPRYTEKCFEATWCTYKTEGKYYSKQKNKKHSSSKNVREKIVLNEKQHLLKTQLCEINRIIYHLKFGKGKVVSYSENWIVVLFDMGEKTFDLDTTIYNGYITLAE